MDVVRPAQEQAQRAPSPRVWGQVALRTWCMMGAAVVAAGLVLAVPFANWCVSYLVIAVHELGHTAAAWLLGCPAIPAFNFRYGGGLTVRWEQSPVLVTMALGLWAVPAYALRRNAPALAAVLVLAGVHAALALTTAREAVILFMGHGLELLIAGVFLYRAWTGRSILTPTERPLYAGLGLFIVFKDLAFAWGLLQQTAVRAQYVVRPDGHVNDFLRLARRLGGTLDGVAAFFLVCCLLPIPLSYLSCRYRSQIGTVLAHATRLDPKGP